MGSCMVSHYSILIINVIVVVNLRSYLAQFSKQLLAMYVFYLYLFKGEMGLMIVCNHGD